MTTIAEIAPDLFRLSIHVPELDLQFNHFLVRDQQPLLFHAGLKGMFPQLRDAVATLIDPAALRYVAWSHFEADEIGGLNQWLELAPEAEPVCTFVGKVVSVDDVALRPARGMTPAEPLCPCPAVSAPHFLSHGAGHSPGLPARRPRHGCLDHHVADAAPGVPGTGRHRASSLDPSAPPMATLPPDRTPLYHHPLPALEEWLRGLGARQRGAHAAVWDLHRPQWSATIELAVEDLQVSWYHDGQERLRHFPYGLARADVEAAILAGP